MGEPSNPPQTSSRRLPLIPVVLVLVMLGLAVFGEKGILRAYQYTRQKQALEEEIQRLETTSTDLRREIESLRNDVHTIESIARRELGMVREDELIYQFRPHPGQGSPASSAILPSPPGGGRP